MASEPQVVVITGASAGVGRATVRAFAKDGARIGLIARGEAGLEAAKQEVEAMGGEALVLVVDVADSQAVEAAAEAVEAHFGAIDVWVNNAMTSVFSPISEMSADEFRRVTEVTYLGTVNGTLSALRRMRARGSGVIVQVGSALAYRSIPLQAAYCAAKHAIKGFTESLWCELLHDDSPIHVTMVHLPALNTPQFNWVKSRLPRRAQPVPPIFQPEVAAQAILWASRHRRREVWVGFSTWKAIIGERVLPRTLDRYLAAKGYSSQQFDGAPPSGQPSNLWEPVDAHADFGAHGDFSVRAQARSWHFEATSHRKLLSALGAGLLGAFWLAGYARGMRAPGKPRRRSPPSATWLRRRGKIASPF
jgi:NAD(P)-dependent dehydrogenase (short-subunit alcohol dehydrogenase family)